MTKLKTISGRGLRYEVVTRLRESKKCAEASFYPEERSQWWARARAFDEVYTEIKGQGIGSNECVARSWER